MTTTTKQWDTKGDDSHTGLCGAIRSVTAGYGGVMRLAHAANISVAAIKKYRAGKSEPSARHLIAMMRADEQLHRDVLLLIHEAKNAISDSRMSSVPRNVAAVGEPVGRADHALRQQRVAA